MRNRLFNETSINMNELLKRSLSPTEEALLKENQALKKLLTEEKIQKIQMYKDLMDSLSREEILIDECERFERRYEALRHSFLGKTTLKYWAFRKKLRR